jgi:hypothetical protein
MLSLTEAILAFVDQKLVKKRLRANGEDPGQPDNRKDWEDGPSSACVQ